MASALSLMHRVPPSEHRPDGARSVHPLLAEFLRAEADRGEVWARVGAWIAVMGAAEEDGRDKRRATLGREHGSVAAWLEAAPPAELGRVAPACWEFAVSWGPVRPWLTAVRGACRSTRQDGTSVYWAWAQLAQAVHEHDEVLEAARRLKSDGDERVGALAAGLHADVLTHRGELDEALRIRREDELPVYERLGGRDLMVGLANLGVLLLRRGQPPDLVMARRYLERARMMADSMTLPFSDKLRAWLASNAGRP